MSGGKLTADNSLTVSGTLTHSGNITIYVAGTKTLTYTGAAISLGANTLTLQGGGNLVSGGLTLNDANSQLVLQFITVDSVSTSVDNSLGLHAWYESTVSNLLVSNILPVKIEGGRSLSGAITVTNNGTLKLIEGGNGFTGTLLSSVSMSGGTTLEADNSLTVRGTLTHTGNITIDVADTKTLTYLGTAISVGANTLTMSGKGTFSNTNALVLNDASSKLLLSNTTTVGSVYTSLASSGIDVNESSTITSLSVAHTTPFSIEDGKTLSLSLIHI